MESRNVKRCIYFVKNNQLFKKTFDVDWSFDCMDYNILSCDMELPNQIPSFISKCLNVSTASDDFVSKSMSTCFLKDEEGYSVKEQWKSLDLGIDKELLPPGSHDWVYICALNERQVYYALEHSAYFDTFHNPDKQITCSAKALASLKLLYEQGKTDYIENLNNFLYWYYINCQFPVEWLDIYESNK